MIQVVPKGELYNLNYYQLSLLQKMIAYYLQKTKHNRHSYYLNKN